MKKISVFLVLLVAGVLLSGSGYAGPLRPAVIAGAYDELLPEAVKGKTFVPSIKLRWEYDDNVYAGEESLKLFLEPKIDVHTLTPTTYFGLSYEFGFIWYDDRPDDTDMAHDALVDVRHYFSPRVEIALRDAFRFTEEPTLPEEVGRDEGLFSYRRWGDYLYNQGSVGLNVQASRQFWLNVNYRNVLVDYDDPVAGEKLDRTANTIGGKLQYLASPQSKVNLGFRFTDTNYDTADYKDSEAWLGYVGLDQEVRKNCVASVFAGWESRDFSNADSSEDNPYAGVSLRSGIGKKGNGTIGYRYSFENTDQVDYAVRETHTFYGGLNVWLAPETSVHANTSYEIGDLQAPGNGGDSDEDIWLLGLVLRHHVTEDLYVEAGYRRTDIDADLEGTSYDRNRFYVGCGGIF